MVRMKFFLAYLKCPPRLVRKMGALGRVYKGSLPSQNSLTFIAHMPS